MEKGLHLDLKNLKALVVYDADGAWRLQRRQAERGALMIPTSKLIAEDKAGSKR